MNPCTARSATDPVNVLLNYDCRLRATEGRISCLVVGGWPEVAWKVVLGAACPGGGFHRSASQVQAPDELASDSSAADPRRLQTLIN
jgi:hypothetical protein